MKPLRVLWLLLEGHCGRFKRRAALFSCFFSFNGWIRAATLTGGEVPPLAEISMTKAKKGVLILKPLPVTNYPCLPPQQRLRCINRVPMHTGMLKTEYKDPDVPEIIYVAELDFSPLNKVV